MLLYMRRDSIRNSSACWQLCNRCRSCHLPSLAGPVIYRSVLLCLFVTHTPSPEQLQVAESDRLERREDGDEYGALDLKTKYCSRFEGQRRRRACAAFFRPQGPEDKESVGREARV